MTRTARGLSLAVVCMTGAAALVACGSTMSSKSGRDSNPSGSGSQTSAVTTASGVGSTPAPTHASVGPDSSATGTDSAPVSQSVMQSPSATPTSTTGLTSTTAGSTPTGPEAVPAPKECSTSACETVAQQDLGTGYQIRLRGSADGDGVSVVELTDHDVPVYWNVVKYETPAELDCIIAGSMRNCVVIDNTGAHAATARAWQLQDGTLHHGAAVTSNTQGMHGRDLNADRLVDVVALQNNYVPDYASGLVFWQTFTSDGTTLTSTGCGPVAGKAPPQPSAPLSGTCPS